MIAAMQRFADVITDEPDAPTPDVLAPMRDTFTLIGAIVFVVGLGILLYWISSTLLGRARTMGTVVSAGATFGRRGGKSGTKLQVRYEAEGETCEIEAHVTMGSWSEGDTVTVRYVPGMPSDGVVPTFFWPAVALFACLFGGAFVLIAFTVSAG